MSDKIVKNNPLLPIWSCVPGEGRHTLQSPNNLSSAIRFLRSLPSTPRLTMRRCARCHRYSTGAPSPDVDHGGSGTGASCNLAHYPAPCDWTDERGRACQYLPDQVRNVEGLHEDLGAGGGMDPSLAAALQQLEQLRKEKEEETRRAEMLHQANVNLRQTQDRLQQLQSQHPVSSPVVTMTTRTTTTVSTAPMMGTATAPPGLGWCRALPLPYLRV